MKHTAQIYLNNPISSFVINISLIVTLCFGSSVVHINLSTEVSLQINVACCILGTSDSQTRSLTFFEWCGHIVVLSAAL